MAILPLSHITALPDKSIVTVGMFDGVHLGHQHIVKDMLSYASTHHLKPVVVTFDCHPRMVLRKTNNSFGLITTYQQRNLLLQGLGNIDVVIIPFNKEMASLSACSFVDEVLCGRLNASAILLGYDNAFGSRSNNDFDMLSDHCSKKGIDLIHDQPQVVNGLPVSSTRIRRALLDGDVESADTLMGHPFSITGDVVHGRGVGHKLGFPTANIVCDPSLILPADGVYASMVKINQHTFPAMFHVGPIPTYNINQRRLEVNIIGYDGDLYGNTITVDLIKRLRGVILFNGEDALCRQIQKDQEETLFVVNSMIL